MRHIKQLLVAALTMLVALTMALPAFAAGNTGTITVENATYGKEYKAYKIFDATYNAADPAMVSYTVDAAHKDFVSTDLFNVSSAADGSGNYSVTKKDTATDAQVIAWVQANYTSFDATGTPGVFDAKNAQVTFENMPYGYYYVTSTLGTAITIDTSHPDVTVKDKNASAPTVPTKNIIAVDGDGVTTSGTTADAHVGSVVTFKIEGNATNYTTSGSGSSVETTENTVYTFRDTYANMTVGNSFTVKVNGSPITNYTATVTNEHIDFVIPLVDENGMHLYPAQDNNSAYIPIEITYDATITADAGANPATNEVGDTKDEVFTYAFQVAKTDGSKPLPGAQFELWSTKNVQGAQAAALTFIDNGDGTYTYSSAGTVTTLDMTTHTTISIKGLDKAWSYTLKETKVPDGYNQVEDIDIEGGSLTKVVKGTDTSTTSTALYKETVINHAGAELPSTGGIGTTIFYVVGGAMVLCGIVMLITKSRLSKTEE